MPKTRIRLDLTMPGDWRTALSELAKQHGLSVNAVIRLAIKRLLDEGVKLPGRVSSKN